VLADGIAQHVSPVFAFATAGEPVTFLQAWLAAVGFTLQVYFDFSAYSDMACGAALFFGIRLPLNFDSPLKATNIIDFWSRWHVTLTRFLTAYIFNPLALALTRRRVAKGLPVLGGGSSSLSAFLHVLALPTLATMLVSGAWHGAGYTFILWGMLHGLYLIVNHAWRQYGISVSKTKDVGEPDPHLARLAGLALTFFAVVCSMVLFRAPDIASALNVFQGMIGLHGVSLPSELAKLVGMPSIAPMMLLTGEVDTKTFVTAGAYVAGLLAIALSMPNSLQVLSTYKPALQIPSRPPILFGVGPAVHWHPTVLWMMFVAVLAALTMMQITGQSEFLYWQF
jgi:D-alanyl-lipoteichoic acid acyltransferase DltB (MBOAT superfamily)